MTFPLIVLSVGAVAAGWLWVPGHHLFPHFLDPVLEMEEEHAPLILMFGGSIVAAGAGFFLARQFYGPLAETRARLKEQWSGLYRFLFNKWYVDELYNKTVVRAGYLLSDLLAWLVDVLMIDGILVNGSAGLVSFIGSAFRGTQTSYVRNYALGMVLGSVVIVLYFVYR
jgi:NADH-quinone oxidoreductase subunit L